MEKRFCSNEVKEVQDFINCAISTWCRWKHAGIQVYPHVFYLSTHHWTSTTTRIELVTCFILGWTCILVCSVSTQIITHTFMETLVVQTNKSKHCTCTQCTTLKRSHAQRWVNAMATGRWRFTEVTWTLLAILNSLLLLNLTSVAVLPKELNGLRPNPVENNLWRINCWRTDQKY